SLLKFGVSNSHGGLIAGTIDLGGVTRIFDIEDADAIDDLTIIGSVVGSAGLAKFGAGQLKLNGANTFSLAASIAAGTLNVPSGASITSAVELQGGVLAGAGTVGAILGSTGGVSPGSSAGVLHSTGNLILGQLTSFTVEINGANPGSGYDQLDV